MIDGKLLTTTARPTRLTLYRYSLSLRQSFKHAAATRDMNEGVIVRLELSDGSVGVGEGIPRPYVTGETIASSIDTIQQMYAERLASEHPVAWEPAPGSAQGVWHNAAWGACELAYLDAAARSERLHLADYMGQRLGREPQRNITQRAAGVLSAGDTDAMVRSLRRMRIFGLRDFKLKVGLATDYDNLRVLRKRIGKWLTRGRLTLRVDANGAWSLDQARRQCVELAEMGVAAVEQPLRAGDEADLPVLRASAGVPVMVDESILGMESAERLLKLKAADYWNLRVTKNGGLLQTLRLAELAKANRVHLMLGALVGESGILSAAARVFLQLMPDVEFLENSYGEFLLDRDLVRQRTRFGYGGRIAPLRGPGLGVTLDDAVMERVAQRVDDIKLT